MKIVGIISNYEEAKEIEDIVKVFLIKERISEIQNNTKNKKIKSIKKIPQDNHKLLNKLKDHPAHREVNDMNLPLFNFRGLS